ncbi:MAG: CBS domain-containing protein [Candidatus Levybacteria bacterium]|nr:CBS domain-containing protein [Candidatus Levybacteria bacterium]
MKVADIAKKDVDFVNKTQSVLEAAKVIFKHGHTGIPVVSGKNKKLIGFITDQDILSQCFPSLKEYIDDVVKSRDFDSMEAKLKEIMKMKVKDVMNHELICIQDDAPLLKAESLMKVKHIARLSVVDNKGNLVGILTKRDIFRALVGKLL